MIWYRLFHHEDGTTTALLMTTEGQAEKLPALDAIAEDVAMGLTIELADLKGPCRAQPLAEARMIFAKEAHTAGYSKVEIARYLCRDHSTVIWALRRYDDLAEDVTFKTRLALVQRYKNTKTWKEKSESCSCGNGKG